VKIIAITNQKGGVGKSTTALSIGSRLRLEGYKVLFVDLDAQGNLTHSIGGDNSGKGVNSLHILTEEATVSEAITHTEAGDIIANSPILASADNKITATGKEYRLKEALSSLGRKYDYVIIDTPPALGILTINALAAANGCIIPAQADIYSLQGIRQLYSTIDAVRKYCNPALKVMGILLTRYNSRTIISREVADMIEEAAGELGAKLYKAKISECTAIKESQAKRMNIFDYAPNCKAAQDYEELIKEILTKKA